MKIDAKVRMLKAVDVDLLPLGATTTVTIDLDNVGDYDDAVSEIEIELYNRYGISLYNEVHFTITNADDIASEIEQMSAD